MPKMTCCLAVLAALLCAVHCQDIRDVELRESKPYPDGTTENDGPSGISDLARLKRGECDSDQKKKKIIVRTHTSDSTDGDVKVKLYGSSCYFQRWHRLDNQWKNDFEAGNTDKFNVLWPYIGKTITSIKVDFHTAWLQTAWVVDWISVTMGEDYHDPCFKFITNKEFDGGDTFTFTNPVTC